MLFASFPKARRIGNGEKRRLHREARPDTVAQPACCRFQPANGASVQNAGVLTLGGLY